MINAVHKYKGPEENSGPLLIYGVDIHLNSFLIAAKLFNI